MVKKTVPAKTPTDDSQESPIHTLKTATTKSLEGSATLTYLIGEDAAGGIHWKIAENSGDGFFSTEWVSFADIQQAFAVWPEDSPITSIVLRPLFQGKSVNTPSFLLAALTAEGTCRTAGQADVAPGQVGPQEASCASQALANPAASSTSKARPQDPSLRSPNRRSGSGGWA